MQTEQKIPVETSRINHIQKWIINDIRNMTGKRVWSAILTIWLIPGALILGAYKINSMQQKDTYRQISSLKIQVTELQIDARSLQQQIDLAKYREGLRQLKTKVVKK